MKESIRPTRILLLAAFVAVPLHSSGCASLTAMREKTYATARSLITSSYDDPLAEEKMGTADRLFEEKDYRRAEKVYADLANNTRNPALVAEKARYHEAECLRMRDKLPDAAATYHRLLQDYPFGAYRERCCAAMYGIAYGWLEKDVLAEIEAESNGTTKPWYAGRMDGFNLFDGKRPLFDTEGEALKVLDNVQTHDGIGPYADKSLYWLGYVNFYRGRFEDADHHFSQLAELHKDSKLRPHAVELAILAKNNSTGGPVYDSGKASEALQLIHQVEATMPGYATDPEKSEMMTRQKFAVRMQLAMKYLEHAQYYERVGRPASAYFYYDLVQRQHAGTKPAEIARERMIALEPIKAKAEADRAAGIKPDPGWFNRLQSGWDRLWMKAEDRDTTTEADRAAANPTPAVAGPPPNSAEVPGLLPQDVRR